MKKISVVALSIVLLLVTGCGDVYGKLEKNLKSKVSSYYEKNLKGKVLGINQHKVDLAALEKSGVDIKEFTDQKCDKKSYALVILTLDKDKKTATSYKVENHLKCGSYKTGSK